jgi:hypothetical protein
MRDMGGAIEIEGANSKDPAHFLRSRAGLKNQYQPFEEGSPIRD